MKQWDRYSSLHQIWQCQMPVLLNQKVICTNQNHFQGVYRCDLVLWLYHQFSLPLYTSLLCLISLMGPNDILLFFAGFKIPLTLNETTLRIFLFVVYHISYTHPLPASPLALNLYTINISLKVKHSKNKWNRLKQSLWTRHQKKKKEQLLSWVRFILATEKAWE